jgi:hypothetical protein
MLFFGRLLAVGVVSHVVHTLPVGQEICYSSRSDGLDYNRVESSPMSVYGETEVIYIHPRQDIGYCQTNHQAKT